MFIGEILLVVFVDLGVYYVIIGYLECCEYFYEIDEDINKKVKVIFVNGMILILCCGEFLEIYEVGKIVEWIEG